MSRIGKQPIPIPKGVTVTLEGDTLAVKGPKGELRRKVNPKVRVEVKEDRIVVSVSDDSRESRSFHGLYRVLVSNMVTGVTKGFEKILDIVGVGYKAELTGRTAVFNLGYSHPVQYDLPDGIDAQIDKTRITLSGIDKELLGKAAAKIRSFKKPEPYKGKGIKYIDEVIRRKAGKAGAS
jgi:large subunit ribosomal protein L6